MLLQPAVMLLLLLLQLVNQLLEESPVLDLIQLQLMQLHCWHLQGLMTCLTEAHLSAAVLQGCCCAVADWSQACLEEACLLHMTVLSTLAGGQWA